MRKIAKAIDTAPNANTESTSELLSANRPIPKNSASVQNTRIAMSTQDTGGLATCSDISNRDCSTMLLYWLAVAKACFCTSVFGSSVAKKSFMACALANGTAADSKLGSASPLPQNVS